MEVLFSILILIIFVFLITLKRYLKEKNKLPPSPQSLPILGHLHLLNNISHLALHKLSLKYGPLISLRLGIRRILVVSSPSHAEECFTKTNDIVFANRPESILVKRLGYNYTTIVFSPYGDHWRSLRRLTAIHIFSSISLQQSSSIWKEEICFIVKKLLSSGTPDEKTWKVVDLNTLFLELVFNVVMKMVAGKRWPPDQSSDIFTPRSFSDVLDYFPILRGIGFGRQEKSWINLQRKRDKFLQDLIDETRKKEGGDVSYSSKTKEIIHALLSLQDAEPEFCTDEIIKGIMQIMFTAGTHTSALTMERVMFLLFSHPEELQKARDEIYNHVIHSGHVLEDSDLSKLPYLLCIINETLRLFPPAPTLVPHFSSEDCTVRGYRVPKGTTLIVNAWAIQRDPNLWEEPAKFKPERFKGIDEGFKFLPFGKGRRACPGTAMAMRLVGLVVGTGSVLRVEKCRARNDGLG